MVTSNCNNKRFRICRISAKTNSFWVLTSLLQNGHMINSLASFLIDAKHFPHNSWRQKMNLRMSLHLVLYTTVKFHTVYVIFATFRYYQILFGCKIHKRNDNPEKIDFSTASPSPKKVQMKGCGKGRGAAKNIFFAMEESNVQSCNLLIG